MKTGNHIADIPDNDPYFDDYKVKLHVKTCDFCGDTINEFLINFDVFNGKNSGVCYCDDCKPEYLKWKAEPENQDTDSLANFGKFTDKLCNNE
jgi:hypothetical protein